MGDEPWWLAGTIEFLLIEVYSINKTIKSCESGRIRCVIMPPNYRVLLLEFVRCGKWKTTLEGAIK